MINFFICGIIFILYSFFVFKRDKIILPSVVFSVMWGGVCLYTAAILCGYGEKLFLREYYIFQYMDTYILYFTAFVIFGFYLARNFNKRRKNWVRLEMDLEFINKFLEKYRWIMWINFWGGILRMILMLRTVGFENMMDYRIAANSMMMVSSFSFVGIVFKLTAYVQMLANFYVCVFGFRTGLMKLDLKKTLWIFVLFAPPQMATGGRLFILYFILFFFGSFMLARGLSMKNKLKKMFCSYEKRILIISFSCFFSLVALIPMLRSGGITKDQESMLEKFSYITEGMLATEYLMKYYPEGSYKLDWGKNTRGDLSDQYLNFRKYLKTTKMDSIVICIFTPLYLDFGYWGSLFIMFIIAFMGEFLSISCLKKLSLIKFFIYIVILKIFYESVMAKSISTNIPNYELIIIFIIIGNQIFKRNQHKLINKTHA